MNEVTKIHLGRQAFAISVDAHRELRNYLEAIKRRVSDEDVVGEVELRMAELLVERGVHGDQVVLPADVNFLKEQLGNPKDFADDDGDEAVSQPTESKRLFRDTNNAMLAGVAAGLATYFGVDVLLIRLAFVIVTFMGGWGILIYAVLWLLVPEAKTSSERLLMVGKPVTIGSLKEVVQRADVKGATQRANRSLAGVINTVFGVVLKIIGIFFVITGIGLLLALSTAAMYVFFHTGSIVQDNLFPVGIKEHLLVYGAVGTGTLLSLFVVLFGMALYRRKWPVRGWVTAILICSVLACAATSGALAADTAPRIRDRYNANIHSVTRIAQPFNSVNISQSGDSVFVVYQTADTYSVSLRYHDHQNVGSIKTTVKDGVLTVDSRAYKQAQSCNGLCIGDLSDVTITINSPIPLHDVNSPAEPVLPTAPEQQ